MAERMTLLDNEYATLWYYPDKKIVHHQFKKYAFDESFREILMTGAEAFEKHGGQKWLSDDRKYGAVHPDDKEWGDANWVPRVVKAGWKYWAMVLPETVVGQMNLKRVTKEYSDNLGVEVNIFTNPDDAMNWLDSKT
jgi:hypothetical protein